MRSVSTVLFVVALVIGSITSLPRVCAEGSDANASTLVGGSGTCGDRYNALVERAKASLIRGDRAGAVDSLVAARAQLLRCQELEERDSVATIAVALNWP